MFSLSMAANVQLQPVTVREFMDFLKYVEHSAENLQFYLWFKDYSKRFEALPETERNLSPEWTQAQEDSESAAYRSQLKQRTLTAEAAAILKSQDLTTEKSTPVSDNQDPFGDSRVSSSNGLKHETSSIDSDPARRPWSGLQSAMSTKSRTAAETAFEDAGCNFQPCT